MCLANCAVGRAGQAQRLKGVRVLRGKHLEGEGLSREDGHFFSGSWYEIYLRVVGGVGDDDCLGR